MALFPLTVLVLLVLPTFLLARRWYRLRHIPGPVFAKFTDLWLAIRVWRGAYYAHIIRELHATYGPVVRWGPNRVSFADPEAIGPVLGTKSVLPKASSYEPMIIMVNGEVLPSLITIRDEKRMTSMKRHISNAFSQSTWLQREPELDTVMRKLIDKLTERAGQTVQINEWLSFWAIDSMGEMAFSSSRQYLEHGKDIDGLFPAIADRFEHWRLWAFMPTLEKLIYKNAYTQRLQRPTSAIAKLAMTRIQARKDKPTDSMEDDLMTRYMLASQKAPEAISPREVLSLTVSTLNAGSETVATSTSLILSQLLLHPLTLQKLEAEILSARLTYPPSFRSVNELTYFDACIREAMRVTQLSPNAKERVSGPSPMIICDTLIPAGTDVSVPGVCTAFNKDVFGEDADAFRPERWVEADEGRWRHMDRAAMVFSHGRRVCIGQHLAWIEMKKVIAALILRFEVELVGKVDVGFENNTKFARFKVKLRERDHV